MEQTQINGIVRRRIVYKHMLNKETLKYPLKIPSILGGIFVKIDRSDKSAIMYIESEERLLIIVKE